MKFLPEQKMKKEWIKCLMEPKKKIQILQLIKTSMFQIITYSYPKFVKAANGCVL